MGRSFLVSLEQCVHQVFETGLVKGDQNHVLFWYYMNVAVRTGGGQDCYVYSIPILLVLPDMEPCQPWEGFDGLWQ